MGNHPFNVIVVLFWLATMTWLVVAKVLPPLRVGEPPSYQAILEESRRQPVACWSIYIDSRPIGWAASRLVRRKDNIAELHSRVYLAKLPLDELAPGWLNKVLKPALGDLGRLDVDKQSQMVIDPLGRLVRFESRVRIAEIRDAIKISGQVEGSTLSITVRSGDIPKTFECYLPPNALMSDELSPQAMMPALRVGQRWTVPLYNPFRPPTSPMEILHAHVEQVEKINWNGQQDTGKLVVFRSDPARAQRATTYAAACGFATMGSWCARKRRCCGRAWCLFACRESWPTILSMPWVPVCPVNCRTTCERSCSNRPRELRRDNAWRGRHIKQP